MRQEQVDKWSFFTPTTWLNSAHVERWLRSIWPGWRMDDVRHEWDEGGRWYWIIPDFANRRSRVLGVEAVLLEKVTVSHLKDALERVHWLQRIQSEHLLIVQDEAGDLQVKKWEAALDEKWFVDPSGGNYVAFPTGSHQVPSVAPGPLPERFLVLHVAKWSAMGPKEPRDVQSYSEDELRPYLPAAPTQKSDSTSEE